MERDYDSNDRPGSSSRIPMRPGNDQDERSIKDSESPVSDLKSARKFLDDKNKDEAKPKSTATDEAS